jgi:NAD(P)-dependent dehydrogenase (short-subunit alcohol dehydrogenase family)
MAVTISLAGKNAIITGAGKGIGAAIAKRLAQADANLVLISRTLADLELVATEIRSDTSVKVLPVVCDVSKPEEINRAVSEAEQIFGNIDILVNNAGVNYRETAFNVDVDHWDTVMNTNLKGYFLMSKAVAKGMVKRKSGVIVNIGSELSFVGVAEGQVAYSTSKAAVNQLGRVLAAEWASYKIRVNTVVPGFTETELVTELLNKPGYKKKFEQEIPLNRLATPGNVADAVLFMASDASAFTTGTTLLVDGGYTNIR